MHVITGLNVGGAENQLALLALERRKRGFEDVVINLTRGGAIKDKLVSGGVIVHDLGLNSSLPNPYSLLRFRKYVNIYKPDIVQSWMYHANLFSVISLKLLASKNLPLIWGIRCSNIDPNKYNFKFRIVLSLCKALSNIADVTLANSYAGKLFHQNSGYKSKQWEVIINGVETKIFKPDMSLRKLKRQELKIAENTERLKTG